VARWLRSTSGQSQGSVGGTLHRFAVSGPQAQVAPNPPTYRRSGTRSKGSRRQTSAIGDLSEQGSISLKLRLRRRTQELTDLRRKV